MLQANSEGTQCSYADSAMRCLQCADEQQLRITSQLNAHPTMITTIDVRTRGDESKGSTSSGGASHLHGNHNGTCLRRITRRLTTTITQQPWLILVGAFLLLAFGYFVGSIGTRLQSLHSQSTSSSFSGGGAAGVLSHRSSSLRSRFEQDLSWRAYTPPSSRPGAPSAAAPKPLVSLLPSPPATSSLVPKQSVAIIFSWSNDYCTYAFVGWRSVRRLDPTRQKDILLMVTRDDEWADVLASAAAMPKSADLQAQLTHLQTAFANSIAAKFPACKALLDLVVYEANLRAGVIKDLETIPETEHSSYPTGVGSTYFTFLTPVRLASDIKIRFPQWHYSIHKMHVFGFVRYERILVLDADVVLVHSLDHYFSDPSSDVRGLVDQWYHCSRGNKINGGLFAFRPSGTLLQAALWTLNHRPTCMAEGQELIEADQSVLNCMCGLGGKAYNQMTKIHDIKCSLMPSYMGIFSDAGVFEKSELEVSCPPYAAKDVTGIHFTWKPKPIDWQQRSECQTPSPSALQLAADADGDIDSPPAPVSLPSASCFKGLAGLFTFWHCISGNGDFDHTKLMEHCEYRNDDQP